MEIPAGGRRPERSREAGTVPAAADLAISLYIPSDVLGAGFHASSQQTSYTAAGDVTRCGDSGGPEDHHLLGIPDRRGRHGTPAAGSIVAFGDSITDGARSTVDANHRWPDTLAARLRKAGVQLSSRRYGDRRKPHPA